MNENSTTGHPAGFNPSKYGGRSLPEKISTLRQKLYQKAKQQPTFRFYALYDRIYRRDILLAAWESVSAKGGAAGSDGVTIQAINTSARGAAGLVDDLHEELRTKQYRPGAVRRVHIPKPDGRLRPLGIPNLRDRVVQAATLLVLEPIFEADFEETSYGFRPGRSAHDALAKVRQHLHEGKHEVFDADLKSYFDTIPHDKLMACIERRITDRSVLSLLRSWLTCLIEEDDEDGHRKVTRPQQGTPQGGVISPLLANAYLHWLDKLFARPDGPASRGASIVRYADDFVILARKVDEPLCEWVRYWIEERMGLTINREKTRVVNLDEVGASLDFLGFTFRYDRDFRGRAHRYLNVVPSKKSMCKERAKIKEMTSAQWCFVPLPLLIQDINRHLRGWANYFDWGYPRMAFRAINNYVRERLARHMNRRSQRRFHLPEGQTYYSYLAQAGLLRL